MVKTAIAGAIFLASAAAATNASAAAYHYIFATASGSEYCDGIKLTTSGVVATGIHDGCTADDYAGGFVSKIKDTGTVIEVLTTDEDNAPGYTLEFLVQPSTLEWALYGESTDDGLTFQALNSGTLVKGNPPKVAKAVGNHASTSKLHAK